MKIYVDEMPSNLDECLYAEWHPYPPFVERVGDWYCKKNNRICNLTTVECYGYKLLPTIVLNDQDEKEKKI